MPITRPGKPPLMQTPCRQPNAQSVVHQHLHAIASAVGKEISTVRLCRTKDSHDPGERLLGAGAHIHRFGGQPNCVDADHEASPRTKLTHPSGSEDGHFTVMVCSPNGSSMITGTRPAFSGRPLPEQAPTGLRVVDLGKVVASYGSRWH